MPLSPQETLEDLDRNKDGYVQVEEYIGEWDPILPPRTPVLSPATGSSRYISAIRAKTL